MILNWLAVFQQSLGTFIGGTVALGGVYLTYRLTDRHERAKEMESRRNELIRLKLNQFYGPLLSMVAELKARKKAFHRLTQAAVDLHTKWNAAGNSTRAAHFSEEMH